jgi:hypothetical protein
MPWVEIIKRPGERCWICRPGRVIGWLNLTASISCWTSASLSLVPFLASPRRSSSTVIVPLLSESMLLNISLSPLISSSERHPAMTCKGSRQFMINTDFFGTRLFQAAPV